MLSLRRLLAPLLALGLALPEAGAAGGGNCRQLGGSSGGMRAAIGYSVPEAISMFGRRQSIGDAQRQIDLAALPKGRRLTPGRT